MPIRIFTRDGAGRATGALKALATATAFVALSMGPASAQTAAPLESYDATTPVAAIGERTITLGDLIRARQGLDQELATLPDELLFNFILQRDISVGVFAAAAERDGLPNDPQVAEQLGQARLTVLALAYAVEGLRPGVDAMLNNARAQSQDPNAEAGFSAVADLVLNEEYLAQGLNPAAAAAFAQAAENAGLAADPVIAKRLADIRTALLSSAYYQRAVEVEVTEPALRARYDETVTNAPTAEEVRARHILVPTQEEAIAVKAEVDGGADFAAVAAAKSTGPSASRGGDLGYFVREQMAEPFGEAAFALQPGAVSEPVQTSYGWHVIKLEDRRPAEKPTFEQVAAQLRRELSRDIAEAKVAELGPLVGLTQAERLPPASAIRQDELVAQ